MTDGVSLADIAAVTDNKDGMFGGAGGGVPEFALVGVPLGNLSDRADHLSDLVDRGAGAFVLGPGGVLRLAVPVWRLAGTDQPCRAAAGRASDRGAAGAA